MIKFIKFIVSALITAILAFTAIRWALLFIFSALALPPLFLTHIMAINWQNLSEAFELKPFHLNIDIYRTPFPLVFMDPKFINAYKTFRIFLIYLTDLLSFIFFIFIMYKITPKNIKSRIITRPSWLSLNNSKLIRGLIGFSVTLIFFVILILQILVRPSWNIYTTTKNTVRLSYETIGLLNEQNFAEAKVKLQLVKDDLKSDKRNLKKISWLGNLPFFRNYYKDITSIFSAAEYAVDSGLIAVDVAPTLNSTSLEKIDEVSPRLEEILNNFSEAKKQIDNIDPNRYPKEIMGKPIRGKIILAKNKIEQLEENRQKFQPLIGVLPDVLGNNKPRHYLVLFQNDNKLRPTGGFITSYGIFRVEKGKITPEGSGDIADLEHTLMRLDPAPEIISSNLSTPLFHLQDANISPDFSESMKNFEKIYKNSYQQRNFDGIFALDGELFVGLLKVLGVTAVYDKALTAEDRPSCSCPGVIDDINQMAQTNKKDIIGIALNAILVKSISSPPKTQLHLARALLKLTEGKHLLFYLTDTKEQKIIETAKLAGRIDEFPGDYLHINEANFSEIEEDRYLKRSVEDSTEVGQDGKISKTIAISYQKLPPAGKTSFLILRFYLPKGSTFLDSSGTQKKVVVSEDLGKTVLETSVEIQPGPAKKIALKYTLPMKFESGKQYQLLRQKQPGIKGYEYTILFNGDKRTTFFLDQDKQLLIP